MKTETDKDLKKKKMKRVLAILGLCLFIGLGSAAYLLSHNSSVGYTIINGQSDFNVTLELSDVTFDLSNDELTNNQSLVIVNENGLLEMDLGYGYVQTNNDPNCDPTGDINFKVFKEGLEYSNNTQVNLTSGENRFDVIAEVTSRQACPTNNSFSLSLSN